MRGFGERLRRRAKELGKSDAQVARECGIGTRRYGNYVTNDREPDLTTLLTIAKALEVSPNWLLGAGGKDEDAIVLPGREHGDIVAYSGEEYAAVPAYDVRASAGAGAEIDSENVKERVLLRLGWIRAITRAPVGRLAIIDIDGDSMEPTLRSGDQVLLDFTQTNPAAKDGLYAIRYDGGGLQVKRLSMHPESKRLAIRSDNPAYPSYESIDPVAIVVIARVVWIGRRV